MVRSEAFSRLPILMTSSSQVEGSLLWVNIWKTLFYQRMSAVFADIMTSATCRMNPVIYNCEARMSI
ncbi:hypothetical protein KC321_g1 [Hortaea werneckii]|nr:hypothetical protein KC321_g1 [Hortaea werneckii]